MRKFIRQVEENYDVAQIKVGHMQVWPFLRWSYCTAGDRQNARGEYKANAGKAHRFSKLKNAFYGGVPRLRKYDYVLFTDTLELRKVKGQYVDKVAEGLLRYLGKDRFLVLERPVDGFQIPRNMLSMKNVLSLELFNIISALLRRLLLIDKRISIPNEHVLESIERDFGLSVNYRGVITGFISQLLLFKLLFRIIRPRMVFVNCYYCSQHQAAIRAAKELGIVTVELQHGIITKAHPAYNVFASLDRRFFPDYLFSFGKYVRNYQTYIEPERVLPVGSYYIDYLNKYYQMSECHLRQFHRFRTKYKKIVAVSSQDTVQEELLAFLKEAAVLDKSILYLFIPRRPKRFSVTESLPNNIKVGRDIDLDLDVYEAIIAADFHVTVYSTCAIEAPALGTPNILIDIEGKAQKYYADLLGDTEITRFVDTPQQLVSVIAHWDPPDQGKIQKRQKLFCMDYEQSVKMAMEKVLAGTTETNIEQSGCNEGSRE